MRKKKKSDEGASEGWLLPYSDIMTLLLALFIILFAMAKIDQHKFEEFRTEFGTILSNHSNTYQTGKNMLSAQSGADSDKSILKGSEAAKNPSLVKKDQLEAEQLQNVSDQLQQSIDKDPNLAKNITVSLQSDGIHINLKSNILFASGNADLNDQAQKALNILAPSLKILSQNPVVIAGYTDNMPYKTNNGPYHSNWELSSARAINVMQYYVNNQTLNESNVSIQAYAENKPRASNSTPAGQAQNRRVEIIIQRINYSK
ncbi:OmpA/MotB family protein [Liquorilactobacillus ghanensis]|nr:flagellar motor protein MotB [Liquorilactobacillus ghanensis]AJA34015.1 chemotaxis protein MotB [Liquorilactobacillus ghanensis]